MLSQLPNCPQVPCNFSNKSNIMRYVELSSYVLNEYLGSMQQSSFTITLGGSACTTRGWQWETDFPVKLTTCFVLGIFLHRIYSLVTENSMNDFCKQSTLDVQRFQRAG